MREEEEMGSSQSSGAVPSSPQEATRESAQTGWGSASNLGWAAAWAIPASAMWWCAFHSDFWSSFGPHERKALLSFAGFLMLFTGMTVYSLARGLGARP